MSDKIVFKSDCRVRAVVLQSPVRTLSPPDSSQYLQLLQVQQLPWSPAVNCTDPVKLTYPCLTTSLHVSTLLNPLSILYFNDFNTKIFLLLYHLAVWIKIKLNKRNQKGNYRNGSIWPNLFPFGIGIYAGPAELVPSLNWNFWECLPNWFLSEFNLTYP